MLLRAIKFSKTPCFQILSKKKTLYQSDPNWVPRRPEYVYRTELVKNLDTLHTSQLGEISLLVNTILDEVCRLFSKSRIKLTITGYEGSRKTFRVADRTH